MSLDLTYCKSDCSRNEMTKMMKAKKAKDKDAAEGWKWEMWVYVGGSK